MDESRTFEERLKELLEGAGYGEKSSEVIGMLGLGATEEGEGDAESQGAPESNDANPDGQGMADGSQDSDEEGEAESQGNEGQAEEESNPQDAEAGAGEPAQESPMGDTAILDLRRENELLRKANEGMQATVSSLQEKVSVLEGKYESVLKALEEGGILRSAQATAGQGPMGAQASPGISKGQEHRWSSAVAASLK